MCSRRHVGSAHGGCSGRIDARPTLAVVLLVVGCGGGGGGGADTDTEVTDSVTDPLDTGHEDSTLLDTTPDPGTDPPVDGEDTSPGDVPADEVPDPPCPPLMVLVDESFCIDRFEAALLEQGGDGSWSEASPYSTVDGRTVMAVPADGIVPQGYISGVEAAAACEAAGKRLCTSDEWLLACRGPDVFVYPYGDDHVEGACNDHYDGHPVIDYFGTSEGIWDSAHMNDPGINQQPGTVAEGGVFAACESSWGAFDMHGNLHEWTADASGTFRGGFYADASINGPGCTYVTTAHSTSYHDYSTGFRCCADP